MFFGTDSQTFVYKEIDTRDTLNRRYEFSISGSPDSLNYLLFPTDKLFESRKNVAAIGPRNFQENHSPGNFVVFLVSATWSIDERSGKFRTAIPQKSFFHFRLEPIVRASSKRGISRTYKFIYSVADRFLVKTYNVRRSWRTCLRTSRSVLYLEIGHLCRCLFNRFLRNAPSTWSYFRDYFSNTNQRW